MKLVINIEHNGNHLRQIGMLAPLNFKESIILTELHTLKMYKKNTIINEQCSKYLCGILNDSKMF